MGWMERLSSAEDEKALVVKENGDGAEDFDRLAKLSEYLENEEFNTNNNFRVSSGSYDGERDKKLDAMNNTAARGVTLAGASAGPMGVCRMHARRSQGRRSDHQLHRPRRIFPHRFRAGHQGIQGAADRSPI